MEIWDFVHDISSLILESCLLRPEIDRMHNKILEPEIVWYLNLLALSNEDSNMKLSTASFFRRLDQPRIVKSLGTYIPFVPKKM